ncbi:MAG: NADH-quinone oxidoreductase subunit A [Planctomycetales bacterium]|nr:NADH-quinone oxidoreductase subunit A [Planctomycetales bacterium]
MTSAVTPIFMFSALAVMAAVGMWLTGGLFGPRRSSAVKQMPYESGMDPIHDARRRFDVRFYLVAVAFLIFDVELLFLYPWAAATSTHGPQDAPLGIDLAVAQGWVACRGFVFAEAMLFIALLAAGLAYAWRRGVLHWR